MSGIVGIWNLNRAPIDQELMGRVTNSMAHRGPDSAGIWVDNFIGLGHRMLHATPESIHEQQPLVLESGEMCLTFDGRVDNREELHSILLSSGLRFWNGTDAELVLQAYKCWGEESPKYIIGDFAYAIWDKKKQTLFCARDIAGVKPFVYYLSDEIFAFASEINTLVHFPKVPREINEVRIGEFLVPYLEGSDKTITFYRNIFRLPPASTLTIHLGRKELKTYWTLDPQREIRFRSSGEYVEAFQDVFWKSVRCRLRANGQVASMLSGGLDSSSIVGVARELLRGAGSNHRLATISAVLSDEARCVEAPYVNAILAQGGLDAHKVRIDDIPLFEKEFERVVRQADDPFILYSAGIPWLASCVAGRNGNRVLFSGLDGDLVASSNDYQLIEMLRSGRILAFGNEALARARFYKSYYKTRKFPRVEALWDYCFRQLVSAYVLSPHTKLYRYLTQSSKRHWARSLKDCCINEAFALRIGLKARFENLNSMDLSRGLSARGIHCSSLQLPFLVAALERYDRLAASQSVELRHPLLDRRLMEFCVASLPEQLSSQGWTKLALRRAVNDIIPESVCWRNFSHLNLMGKFSFKLFSVLNDELVGLAKRGWQEVAAYVDISRIERIFTQYHRDAPIENQWPLWQTVFLMLWLRNITNFPFRDSCIFI